MDKSTVRVRPLRFAFLVEPTDKASLKDVFELNSALWGGVYNFIIPVFKGMPRRYRIPYFRTPAALDMRKGLIEAFQPDFLVETKAGAAAGLGFSQTRVISYRDLLAADDQGRRKIGIDLRSVCDELYDTTYKFLCFDTLRKWSFRPAKQNASSCFLLLSLAAFLTHPN